LYDRRKPWHNSHIDTGSKQAPFRIRDIGIAGTGAAALEANKVTATPVTQQLRTDAAHTHLNISTGPFDTTTRKAHLAQMNDIATTYPAMPDIEPITLPDGHVMTAKATLAIMIHINEGAQHEQIAQRVGYAAASSVSQLLSSARGQQAVEVALRQHLQAGAVVGFRAMMRLAQGAKSENVRQLAAADLMDRAGLRTAEATGVGHGGQGRDFTINIDLSGTSKTGSEDVITVQGTNE